MANDQALTERDETLLDIPDEVICAAIAECVKRAAEINVEWTRLANLITAYATLLRYSDGYANNNHPFVGDPFHYKQRRMRRCLVCDAGETETIHREPEIRATVIVGE